MTPQTRFVRRDSRLVSDATFCALCGLGWDVLTDGAHRVSTCKACGTPQCMVNGIRDGACSVCLYGILIGFSGDDHKCNYAGCDNEAVILGAPRIGHACEEHLNKCKIGKITAKVFISQRLRERNIEWVEAPEEEAK